MKVQVPSEETFKARYRLSPEWCEDHPVLFEVRYAIFCDGIVYANEQLASPLPTKRPFLSDDEIEDEVKDFDYAEDRELYRNAARWARDKYEARDGSDVATVEPDQTFYVVKRDEEPRYLNPGFGWQEKPMLTTSAGEHNRWKRDLDLMALLPDNPTARIVKVMVSEVGE